MKKSIPGKTSLVKSVIALFLITGIAAIGTTQAFERQEKPTIQFDPDAASALVDNLPPVGNAIEERTTHQ